MLIGTNPAQAFTTLYSHDFENQDSNGGFFAKGISGGMSGGVNGTVIYPSQHPNDRFTGPIVNRSTKFENEPSGADYMQNYFYLGGGTKDNVQPASFGRGPQDPVVLSLNGLTKYDRL